MPASYVSDQCERWDGPTMKASVQVGGSVYHYYVEITQETLVCMGEDKVFRREFEMCNNWQSHSTSSFK